MAKHKQEKYIKAWAQGHEIEWKTPSMGWTSVGQYPYWYENTEYRVKPAEKVVRWLWAFKYSGRWYTHNQYLTDAESEEWFEEHDATSSKKLKWSQQEFDDE